MEAARQWIFSVNGMHCAKCIRKIQESSKSFAELRDLSINFADSTLKFNAPENFTADQYAEKIRHAGFEIRLLTSEEKQNQKTDKWFLARIAVAGACAGNIMLLSVSTYSSDKNFEFENMFGWISFGLFLPVLLFSAWPILKEAALSVKARRLSVDTPLALAIVGSFLLSSYNLLSGSSLIYFDSLSMFVFFLLGSRYFIYRLQLKYLSPVSLSDLFQKQEVHTSDGRRINIKDLKATDSFCLSKGEYLPVDAQVMNGSCEFDNSIVTGESFPILANEFERLPAGARLISNKCEFKALGTINESRTYHLVQNINNILNQETHHTQLVDKGAHYLTLAIISVASAALLYFAFFDIQTGLERVLALLVVACPCGLAIATPLAHSLSVKKALGAGILIKNIKALEELPQCHAIVFDKTGTLTAGDLNVGLWQPIPLSLLEKQILYSLENKSEHPVAKSILRNIGEQKVCELEALNETPGKGVSANYNGDHYLVKTAQVENEYQVQLLKNGEIIKFASLIDSIPDASRSQIKNLKSMGHELYILSGDKIQNSQSVGKELEIDKDHIFAEVSPEEKLKILQRLKSKHKKIFYIGDGINDALSLASANVSASTHTSASIAFKSASAHFLKPGIQSVSYFIHLAKRNLTAIQGNIFLSFIYNSVFAALALAGFISPLLAVILMPASSLATVFWSLYFINRKGLA